MDRVSVVLPTYNRADVLERVLPSYLSQDGVEEVLIVDDGSEPPVDETLSEPFSDDARIRVVRHPRSLGLPAARNTGIQAAGEDLIFFGEDDVVLGDGHVATLSDVLAELDGDIVCGRLFQQQRDETFAQTLERLEGGVEDVFNPRVISVTTAGVVRPTEVPFAHCLLLMPTELAARHLFSTKYGGPSFMREDAEFQLRLRRHGHRLWVTPGADVFHLAKRVGAGGGTRDYSSVVAQAASSVANLSMLVDEYHPEIAPFFDDMSRDDMLRRAVRGHVYLALKNWGRSNSEFVDRAAQLWNRLRWTL
jgi:hypothetical protein